MKNKQNLIKHSIFTVFVLFFFAVLPQLGEDLKERPDSIRYITGLKVDDSTIEELSGKQITEFRIYFTSQTSYIVWKYNNEYFVYTFSDSNHLKEASLIFEQIQENGIETFAAYRDGKKIRFNKYRKVLAFQLKATNQGRQQ